MNRKERRRHNADTRKLPKALTEVPKDEWPTQKREVGRFAMWRSRRYVVQAFHEPDEIIRLSINRVQLKGTRWLDDLTWDELDAIKREIGYGNEWAIELYPADEHIVNVANMRHLWLLPGAPTIGWRTHA